MYTFIENGGGRCYFLMGFIPKTATSPSKAKIILGSPYFKSKCYLSLLVTLHPTLRLYEGRFFKYIRTSIALFDFLYDSVEKDSSL